MLNFQLFDDTGSTKVFLSIKKILQKLLIACSYLTVYIYIYIYITEMYMYLLLYFGEFLLIES